MREFRIFVAYNGRFLFKTDWDDDKARTISALAHLQQAFPADQGFDVSCQYRSKACYEIGLEQLQGA